MMISTLLAVAQTLSFTADRIAADDRTHALTATGHIVAASGPVRLRGEYMTRSTDGKMIFHDPTCATTCSNEVGHTHWNVTGEVEYQENDHVLLRNMVLRFYEVPVFWLPYVYYPLDWGNYGFSWMPGYTGRWGAFLLTKYTYHLLGDPEHGKDTWWLGGATRFDLRYRQGIALGEDLSWNLGDYGAGEFNVYYAWDDDVEEYSGIENAAYTDSYHSYNWESPVKRDRYAIAFRHRLDLTERDIVRLSASVISDSSFRSDFQRSTLFNWKSQWLGYDNSGVFWEHVENAWAVGAEVSGRLNEFYGMTDRLPEFYLDVHPLPVFNLPINYETENRFGYLRRNPAEYGSGDPMSAFTFNPGRWASFDTFRFDTYHRLTAPFKTFDDVLSVVPRVGYHGTGWTESGEDDLTGWGAAKDQGGLFRSILEGGATFAARGTGWIDDKWQHLTEPYLDVLAQKAWMSSSDRRPYVFDAIDASMAWEDQFAGRARNLPYTYYGITPGWRNTWSTLDEHGRLWDVVDFDVYAAVQFGATSFEGANDAHKLAKPGEANYGKRDCFVSPGARIRWNPEKDLSIMSRAEYDSDYNRLAVADVGLYHRLADNFSYNATYALRDYRFWDFSSMPYSREQMTSDDFNFAKCHYIHLGFEHQPIDWLAWGPYVRWDIRQNELDGIGSWFDYLTDCLGFRFIVEYQNSYTRIDGYEHEDDWSFGFYIYLRAFGADSNNLFSSF